MYMGTEVFGFRNVRTGEFHPMANYSFRVVSHCDGDRFSYPSWQLEVSDRGKKSFVIVPDNLDSTKSITAYISAANKRSYYAKMKDKVLRDFFEGQVQHHIDTRDYSRILVSYTGTIQKEDLSLFCYQDRNNL